MHTTMPTIGGRVGEKSELVHHVFFGATWKTKQKREGEAVNPKKKNRKFYAAHEKLATTLCCIEGMKLKVIAKVFFETKQTNQKMGNVCVPTI